MFYRIVITVKKLESDSILYHKLFVIFILLKKFIFWPHHGACGIRVPQPWIEPSPLAVEAQSLNHWATGAFPFCYLKIKKFIYLHFWLCWAFVAVPAFLWLQ